METVGQREPGPLRDAIGDRPVSSASMLSRWAGTGSQRVGSRESLLASPISRNQCGCRSFRIAGEAPERCVLCIQLFRFVYHKDGTCKPVPSGLIQDAVRPTTERCERVENISRP
jgi:hypothetical protein